MTSQDAARLNGREVYGSDGDKIGTVGHVWGDPAGAPTWASVKTGMFGMKESMVPVTDADVRGERLVVPFDKSQVKDAPRIDGSSEAPLDSDEIIRLHDYYGIPRGSGGAADGSATMGSRTSTTDRRAGGRAGFTADDVIEDRATTDDAMTRSEERLTVATERERIGHAHLRKYVVTEEQQITVPISHDEVRLEREPITDANLAAANAGPELTESEYDVDLYAERPVIAKETVPVERVRMKKETVTEQQTVHGEVRKEHIEAALPNEEKRDLD